MPQDWQGFYESPAIDELIAQPALQSGHRVAGLGFRRRALQVWP
jgi:hypothetical protein